MDDDLLLEEDQVLNEDDLLLSDEETYPKLELHEEERLLTESEEWVNLQLATKEKEEKENAPDKTKVTEENVQEPSPSKTNAKTKTQKKIKQIQTEKSPGEKGPTENTEKIKNEPMTVQTNEPLNDDEPLKASQVSTVSNFSTNGTDIFVSSSDIDESNRSTSKSVCDTTSSEDILDLYVTTHEITDDNTEEEKPKESSSDNESEAKQSGSNLMHSNNVQPPQNWHPYNKIAPPGVRMDYRGPSPRPHMMQRFPPRNMLFSSDVNNFRQRGNFPGNRPQFRPYGDPIRQNMSGPPFDPLRQRLPMYRNSIPPPFGMPRDDMGQHHQGFRMIRSAPPMIQQPPPVSMVPRKVLINPNFKGGVEAAKNQLIRDYTTSRSITDEELLRQQEEFINKNIMQIERRRHERSLSPPDREREYSPRRTTRPPPPRKPFKRYSPKREGDYYGKRRKSSEREPSKNNENVDNAEDEETRKYRLEIEKQKEIREKMMREKERRRKQAIEAKMKTQQQETKKVEEPAQSFTPIVVTEKKIISLKRIKDDLSDAPEITLKAKKSKQEGVEVTDESSSNNLSQNRRIILKSDAGDSQKIESSNSKNRIFDRLEKKISVNESIKRNIQKMVKNNLE